MRIIDLEPRYENSYLACFEEWSSEMKEAGNHKCQWYAQMKDKGLRVKIAVDEQDRAYGMIQYVPIELSPVKGQEMYFIDCIWVHGHKEGLGNMQKQGTGVALIKAAEKDVQSLGAKGMVAWGLAIPVWMKASWYKKQGYKKIDRNGMAALLWKPFSKAAVKPSWIKTIKQPQANANPGKVTVVAFYHPKCQSPSSCWRGHEKPSRPLGIKSFMRNSTPLTEMFFLNGESLTVCSLKVRISTLALP